MAISEKLGPRAAEPPDTGRLSAPGRALAWLRVHELEDGGIQAHSNPDAYPEVTGSPPCYGPNRGGRPAGNGPNGAPAERIVLTLLKGCLP